MCGIAGIFSFQPSVSVTAVQIKKMTDAIRHRGPDDEGIYIDQQIGLGHRRLSIIDLSPDGHQPMIGPDGSTQIIYNGELYNYLELRAELKKNGHLFKSQSDTEVILHAYQEYGPECLSHFTGMFAFALWDEKLRRLFLARDRFGIKPLYFYRSPQQFLFASEIKALLPLLESRPQPNQRLVYDFLTTGMLDHTDETFFAGIQKLPPAHYMLVEADGRQQTTRYWDFLVSNDVARLTEKDIAARCSDFFDIFTNSIRSHLLSDVAVGSCLSGGLDSSTVVSVISQLVKQDQARAVGPRQQTFSACYQNSAIDEQHYINIAVKSSGALSHRVFPKAEGFRAAMPQLLWHQEEPFASTSIYAQWEVMRLAKENGVVVLLDGQGADEQLLGYRKFYFFYISQLLRHRGVSLGFIEMLKHFSSWEVLKTLQWRRGLRYLPGRNFGSSATAQKILRDGFFKKFSILSVSLNQQDTLANRIKADMTRFSVPVLLRYEDKNSMAFSRESRVPFLDHRLVEYVAALPLNLKLRDGWTKFCLRRGAQNVVPPEILHRKDKLGFATPEDEWFRHDLKGEVKNTFASAIFLPEFIRLPELQSQFDAFVNGQRPLLSSDFFFRFFILEHWARMFCS